jgi:hypothetical protein
MKRFALLGVLVSLALVALAAPAMALNLPGCGAEEFLIYSNGPILFENGPLNLTGNVLSRTGHIQVGSDNIIHGEVSAPTLFVGTNAVVDVCNTNNKTGPGTCGVINPFVLDAACTFPPVPVPTFPAVCNPGTNLTAPAGQTIAPAPGCYNQIRVEPGATINLQAGQNYFAKSEVRVRLGGTLQSNTPGSAANVVTKSIVISENQAVFKDLNLTTLNATGNAVNFFNANVLENVFVFSPFGGQHPHTGTQLRGTTELVAQSFQIEPITNTPPPPGLVCICPTGTVFKNFTPTNPEDRACVPVP